MVGKLRTRKTRRNAVETDSDDDDAELALLECDSADEQTSPVHRPDLAAAETSIPDSTAAEERRRRVMEFRHLHKVFFLRKDLILHDEENSSTSTKLAAPATVRIVRLRNPANNCSTHYICQHSAGLYYNLVRYGEPARSWLVSDMVTIDGAIFMTTLIDPLFLVLPYLRDTCSERFVPLDQALKDSKCPEIERFVDALPMTQILLIADQKGPADLKAVRFSEEKTMNWLAFKCDKYMKVLVAKGHHIEKGAKSETYVKSEKLHTDAGDNARMSLAISLLNEYLPKALHPKLLERLGAVLAKPSALPGKAALGRTDSTASTSSSSSHKRRPTSEAEKELGSEKRARDGGVSGGSSSGDSPATPKTEEKRTSAKEKALAKAAAGTKGILSFFKRK